MFAEHNPVIHALLAEHRVVEPQILHEALAATPPGESLVQRLVAEGQVTPEAVLERVAQHLGVELEPGLPRELPVPCVNALTKAVACAWRAVVIAQDAEGVTVATEDPFRPALREELEFALGRAVRVVVSDPAQVKRLLRRHYGDEGDDLPAEVAASGSGVESIDEKSLSDSDLQQLAGQEQVVRFVNGALAQAIRSRASDLHFEPFEREFRVRYRVDGTMQDWPSPPRTLALPVISRLKVLANVNIAERRIPQDGRIRLAWEGRTVDLRLSTLPTQFGESVVLRVLDQSAGRLELDELGLPSPLLAGMERAIARPHGIVLVTGPTGSGKTTTLYSCLKRLNKPGAKLLTVEDPVEYEIEGVMQVPVNPVAGLTFAKALRTFLRQDPDVVMVGEIRDLETAQIAIQAALTGHLVLSTLHTNDAAAAVTRLVDMGIEPFLLSATVEAVLAQRLLRRICLACRIAYEPTPALLRQLESEDPTLLSGRPFYRGPGCSACEGSGYRGRLGLYELLPLTEPLRERIAAGVSLLELKRQAVSGGMTTLRTAGVRALLAGDTSVEEVLKYT